MAQPIGPGADAPEFTLPSTPDQKVSLSELRGRPVVLAFGGADLARRLLRAPHFAVTLHKRRGRAWRPPPTRRRGSGAQPPRPSAAKGAAPAEGARGEGTPGEGAPGAGYLDLPLESVEGSGAWPGAEPAACRPSTTTSSRARRPFLSVAHRDRDRVISTT